MEPDVKGYRRLQMWRKWRRDNIQRYNDYRCLEMIYKKPKENQAG